MKNLTTLFVALALVTPAFAQNPALQEIQKNRKGTVVTPAVKPVLLHTGKPITQNDKIQLHASVVKAYSAKMPGMKIKMQPQETAAPTATSATISPSHMFQNGLAVTEANAPLYVNMDLNEFMFSPGETSYLDFIFTVQANMTYALTFKVSSFTQNPQFTIFPSLPSKGAATGSETFTGSYGNDEFAYAFVSNSAGIMYVTVYSPNVYWTFTSCEITATPIS
jgi:hypothetical protein